MMEPRRGRGREGPAALVLTLFYYFKVIEKMNINANNERERERVAEERIMQNSSADMKTKIQARDRQGKPLTGNTDTHTHTRQIRKPILTINIDRLSV